ncbi:MAG: uracil-DNA glycosylase [Formivibrio sp.]|nr:uracil-DNA glycosylase [Formivibrio sp.]
MNRQALILQELQLAPLWVRRELLQTAADQPEETTALPAGTESGPGEEAQARHPLPAVARAANKALAPLIAPHETARAPHVSVPIPPKPKTIEPPIQDNGRAAAIATMDWNTLQAAVAQCDACALCKTRQQTVFGVGNLQPDIVVVGEAPGEEEDRMGEPFVGRAGKLLDNMLAAIGEKRGERVYIANVLKCRPPSNRNPLPSEIALCAPYLQRQLELLAPKVILAAGRFAAQLLLDTEAPLSALRSKPQQWRGIPVVVTYHPAYLLRNLPDKSKSWNDLLRLQEILHSANHAKSGDIN